MAPVLNLVYAGLDFTKAPSFSAGLKQFAYDRSLLAQIWEGTVMFVKESWTWLDTHIPSRKFSYANGGECSVDRV